MFAAHRSALALLPVLTLLFLTGCAGADRTQPTTHASPMPSIGAAAPRARPLGQQRHGSLSARAVVQGLAQNGFLVPNPLDVTAQICPANGCDQSIVTDTLRVTSFRSPDAAKRYAHERGLRRSDNIVVAFPPVMPATEQDTYWSAILRICP